MGEQALNLLQDMRWQSVEGDAAVYDTLASTCSRSQQWTKSLQVMVTMQNEGFYPSVAAWTTFLASSVQFGGRSSFKTGHDGNSLRRSIHQQLLMEIDSQGMVHEDLIGAEASLGHGIGTELLAGLFLRRVETPTVAALRRLRELPGGRAPHTELAEVDGLGVASTRNALA